MKLPSMTREEVDTNHSLLRVPEPISISKLVQEDHDKEQYYVPVKDMCTREDDKVSKIIMNEGYGFREYGIVFLQNGPDMWYGSEDIIFDVDNIPENYIDIVDIS